MRGFSSKIIAILVFMMVVWAFPLADIRSAHYSGERNGYILLQVEENGEAWYVYPADGERYYMGRPADAFELMKRLSLGARHAYIAGTDIFPNRLLGRILLDVEQNGEAYYIYPGDGRKYYLGRPADAFRIMRELGRGISSQGLVNIPVGHLADDDIPIPDTGPVAHEAPFTSQAPFGNWEDQRQQDGCEEASALMAVRWARDESLAREQALTVITGASDYLLNKYGEYRDISSADTVNWIFKDYFNYDTVELKKNITISDIVDELRAGNLVLTAMNGQIMHNPNFTPPGPPRHMVVITGYDPGRDIFITNDPGTRNGEDYEYPAQTFYEAIRDYPTGYHELIEKVEKNMIVVKK